MKIVAISGYFNPIHSGHIHYIREAKKLGGNLIVILNSDKQVRLKGSTPFMNEIERRTILNSIRYVDGVLISVDKDLSVSKTLEFLKPDIFANGGDRKPNNIPEYDICKKLQIEMIFNVGGEKVQSSSWLLKNISRIKENNI